MGKLTIISSNDDGSYTATVEYDTTVIDTKIALLETRIADLQTFIDDPASNEQEIMVAKVRQLSASKMKSLLENTSKVPANYNTTVWCADYTTDLTGSVGSIEIGTEIKNGVNIQPGYESNAVYNGTRDGQLTPSMALSGPAFFYDMCMLPGTQKWRPGHRYGTITGIDHDADTCDVTLDALTSSHQGLDINQGISLEGVTIEYMDCNSFPFGVDDKVIVKFENYDFDSPKVIGFKKEPKQCAWIEPFDGPLYTSLHEWIVNIAYSEYIYSEYAGDHTEFISYGISTEDDESWLTLDASETTEAAELFFIGYELIFHKSGYASFFKNSTKCIFSAAIIDSIGMDDLEDYNMDFHLEISGYVGGVLTHIFLYLLNAYDSEENYMYTPYWTATHGIGLYTTETEWVLNETFNIYIKGITQNNLDYINFPVTFDTVVQVLLSVRIASTLTVTPVESLPAAGFTVNYIEIS